jgi:hypothetical protein
MCACVFVRAKEREKKVQWILVQEMILSYAAISVFI